MNFKTWVTKEVPVTKLRLDPDNPRLATSVKRPTQAELIAELLRHEDVMTLVKDISKLGYFPNELLVAVKEQSSIIVIEGNRRLAALKLLLNPDLAPADEIKKVRAHADRNHHRVEKATVLIAPSRAAAVALIVARHKGESVKKWTTAMQARYLRSRADEGLSIDDIAEETGIDRPEVVSFLRYSKLYDVVRSLALPAEVQSIVSDPRTFNFTTLTRVMDYVSVQSFLGIKHDEKFGFVVTGNGDRFQQMLGRIVSDVATGDITSRTHNTGADVAAYLRTIERTYVKEKRPASKEGKDKSKPADEFVDPARLNTPAPKPRKRTTKPNAPVDFLIPKGFRVDIEDIRINELVTELKSLRLSTHKNAVAITFRSLLDMAVTKYMGDQGHLKTVIENFNKKQKQPKPSDWLPTLNQLLVYLDGAKDIPLGPEGRKALKKFTTDTTHSLTLDSLNWFTHVRYIPPTAEQLRSFWVMLTPLLELTLQDKTN